MATQKKETTRQERLNGETDEPLFEEQQPAAAAPPPPTEPTEQEAPPADFGNHENPENLDFNQDFKNLYMDFDALEGKEGQEITADFLSLETINDNQAHNYFVTGHTKFTDNVTGEQRPAVKLIGKGNVSLICGARVVVTACENITKFPTPIRIIVNGKTKGKNGAYWNARVLSL